MHQSHFLIFAKIYLVECREYGYEKTAEEPR